MFFVPRLLEEWRRRRRRGISWDNEKERIPSCQHPPARETAEWPEERKDHRGEIQTGAATLPSVYRVETTSNAHPCFGRAPPTAFPPSLLSSSRIIYCPPVRRKGPRDKRHLPMQSSAPRQRRDPARKRDADPRVGRGRGYPFTSYPAASSVIRYRVEYVRAPERKYPASKACRKEGACGDRPRSTPSFPTLRNALPSVKRSIAPAERLIDA